MSRAARNDPKLGFDALSIEGALLQPEWLSKVARRAAGAQTEAEYGIDEGLNLRDELSRAWRMAQARWSRFAAGRAQKAEPRALAQGFITDLLSRVFGFDTLVSVPPLQQSERCYPIGHAALDGRVPVIIAPAGLGLDTLDAALGDGGRRRSAFGLGQEALNATEGALWGLVTDGLTLRLLRDNQSLTRPTWIQADLARIFTEERFADFTALWLLIHQSRFGRPGQPTSDCPLEQWRNAGREEGTRAREHLRQGVEVALVSLGQGFIQHPDNGALRASLQRGALSDRAFMGQLLRLVYRLIFLLTVEERELLHPERTPAAARALYAEGYGLRRLRERSARRSAHDRHGDAWEAIRVVLRGLATGEERLGLPALSGIFAASQCPDLDGARLENRALMGAIYKLGWIRDRSGLSRVNWRDMGPEELGSVYESLLELVPRVSLERRSFSFAEGDESKGNARKTTGSYYTPDSLVSVLLDSALEPVISDTVAANPGNPASALLKLSVVDPACGSGHFLLAAARRLAGHVARHKAGGTPSAAEYRRALRSVVGKCIHGVDLNPMAVELCKVALWMEAVEPGLPLGFLDAHIRVGNALLGATPALLEAGVPDAAWAPIEGDDKKTASALKKRNKSERAGQKSMVSLWSKPGSGEAEQVEQAVAALDAAPDEALAELSAKESKWAEILASGSYQHQRFIADAWCAAFVWPKPKDGGPVVEAAPTDGVWRDLRDGRGHPSALMVETVEKLARQYEFFHWHLAFPTVFKKGGFDVVLGNPPWDQIELKDQEFFAARNPEIAKAPHAAARTALIAALSETDPRLWIEWAKALRTVGSEAQFTRSSGRFPLCARGRINTYALFAEHNRSVLGPRGRAGFIVPTGIATDDTTKEYFGALVVGQELASLYSFENEEFVFPSVHHAFKFALLTVDRAGQSVRSDLVFFARQVSALADPSRHFSLSPADFAALNPNTRTCPTFRSRRDADINLELYRRAGVLWREDAPDGNLWGLRFMQGLFNMASDSGLFRTREELERSGWRLEGNRFVRSGEVMLPLYEAKMAHFFDHRLGTYDGQSEAQANQGVLPHLSDEQHDNPTFMVMPRYWVDASEVDSRLRDRWERGWLFGFRDVARATEYRTCICGMLPRVAVGHKFPLVLPEAEPAYALYANLSSFVLDYACRQKFSGASLALFVLRQLPVLPPSTYSEPCPWDPAVRLSAWLRPRVLELTYTAWDLQPFAQDLGHEGGPFHWDAERRSLLRAELDAAFFHLYGLGASDLEHIMESFFVAKKYDEREYSTYRTKELILQVYDAMAHAARTGTPYATLLDPPPADPSVAHEPRPTSCRS